MKNLQGRTIILQIIATLTMTILMSAGVAMAQTPETLVPGTTIVHYGGPHEVYDFVIPSDFAEGRLNATVLGADGGRRYYNDGFLIDDHYAGGGGGAFLNAVFDVGPDGIPPGSTVRLISGTHGDSDNFLGDRAAGGGGGTGILFRAPGAGVDDWQVVIAAGAGGGACSDWGTNRYSGENAQASDCSSDGLGGLSHSAFAMIGANVSGGGGGAYGDAVCDESLCSGVSGGKAGFSSGGEGGNSKGRNGG